MRILYTMTNKFKPCFFKTHLFFICSLAALMISACTAQTLDTSDVRPEEQTGAEQVLAAEKESKEVLEPTSEEVMYHVFAAEFLGSEGDLEAAVGEYLEAALQSGDAEIARRATQVAFAAQAWLQAAMAADRWAFLDPDDLEAHQSAATAMLLTGDYAGAELQLLQIIDLKGSTTEAWILISSLLAQSADANKASAVLENVLAGQGAVKSADAMFSRSHLAARFRDLKGGYEYAEKAVELDPERIEFQTW